MATAKKVQWTGKNLAEIKRIHKDVAHFPEREKDPPHYRDWTQHPDNLHVTTEEGHTVILEIGDSLVKDDDGTVRMIKSKNPRAPRSLRPVPPSKGTVHHVTGEARRKNAKPSE